ncbi:hypothetical protein [Sulfobacillus harzensis]|uniref:DUF1640 domain-containing protein n=1 Tax=Sulfobacillus harzensis TaxID=2729629 RepID=A0A7Y0Q246_9FIRM|nr:hypothetical protein [Sulfobacillus harzensis]NMP20794.1 hypothetical protein [Sulfobacillus harzensis]
MPEPQTDHDRLVQLETRVADYRDTLTRVDDRTAAHAERLGTLDAQVAALQASHTRLEHVIQQRMDGLEQKVDGQQARTETRLATLDDKLDTRLESLQGHVDEGFATMRRDVADAMDKKEAALPRWAQVGLYILSVGVGILVGIITALGRSHP